MLIKQSNIKTLPLGKTQNKIPQSVGNESEDSGINKHNEKIQ